MTANHLPQSKAQRRQFWLLFAPGAIWLLLFFILPLLIVLVYSFFKRGPYGNVIYTFTGENYVRLADSVYSTIFTNSFGMAVLTTAISLLVGYPLAYFIATRPLRWRGVLLLLVIIPFWTNFLVRTYAIMVIFRKEGVINTVLQGLGLIQEPLGLMFTPFVVIFGLVYGYLPFMVLPLYASIERFDFSLIEAASDLGASKVRSFLRVMLPLTMPGIVAGCILVFIPAIGAFITPDLLGGAKTMMIGNLTQQQFLKARNWPFGSATSIALMVIVALATIIYFRYTDEEARA